jgi:hypothetical protein
VSALLASDGVTSLERNLGVAVTAEVVDGWTIDGASVRASAGSATSLDRRGSWDLVLFARHFDMRYSMHPVG